MNFSQMGIFFALFLILIQPSYGDLESPRKQMEMLEHPSDVLCNEGLELVKKNSNGNAVCLSKDSAKILVQRGWADYF